jgi:hypothetical protein
MSMCLAFKPWPPDLQWSRAFPRVFMSDQTQRAETRRTAIATARLLARAPNTVTWRTTARPHSVPPCVRSDLVRVQRWFLLIGRVWSNMNGCTPRQFLLSLALLLASMCVTSDLTHRSRVQLATPSESSQQDQDHATKPLLDRMRRTSV